ncbi:hypothetical protein ACFC63_18380 [Streptomyces albidoflavus]
MTSPTIPRLAGGVFSQLDADWARLCADPDVQAAVADWLMADQLADSVATVADEGVADAWARRLGPAQLLAALRPGAGRLGDGLADAVLRALLRRAAGRDRSATLAARIVVQAMIPAAVRMARGQVRPFGGRSFEDVGHVTVAALWSVARSGTIHPRPGRPAANLALDTLRHLCAELSAERELLGGDLAAAEMLPAPGPGPVAAAEAAEIRALAAAAALDAPDQDAADVSEARLDLLSLLLDAMDSGALTAADAQAIAWHYTGTPVPDAEAGAHTGVSAGAWQRRRSRAVGRLKASLRTAA